MLLAVWRIDRPEKLFFPFWKVCAPREVDSRIRPANVLEVKHHAVLHANAQFDVRLLVRQNLENRRTIPETRQAAQQGRPAPACALAGRGVRMQLREICLIEISCP